MDNSGNEIQMTKELDISKWLSRDMADFYVHLYRQLDAFYALSAVEKGLFDKARADIDRWFLSVCANAQNKFYMTPDSLWPLHNSQYATFIYIASNVLYTHAQEDPETLRLCDKLYNLNKMVSGFEAHYTVMLPKKFFTDHPYGTGLGRTRYSDHFLFIQGVTVGNYAGHYPTFGDCVALMSHCKILGNCHIGNNVIVSANAFIKNRDIPDDSIVFGSDRDLVVKTGCGERNRAFFSKIFVDLA